MSFDKVQKDKISKMCPIAKELLLGEAINDGVEAKTDVDSGEARKQVFFKGPAGNDPIDFGAGWTKITSAGWNGITDVEEALSVDIRSIIKIGDRVIDTILGASTFIVTFVNLDAASGEPALSLWPADASSTSTYDDTGAQM